MRPRTVDLFCGCGGLSAGLASEGFDVVAGIDSWEPALRVYGANSSHSAIQHDLSDEAGTLGIVSKYRPDVIAGGPPCQDFSSAGKREEGRRADLTPSFARLVAAVKPRAFIMENVSIAGKSRAYATATEIFRSAGYGLTVRVLDASLCGVPQKRKRLFMVGALGAVDGFLDGALDGGLSKTPMTLRDYFGDSLGFEHYYRHPRSYHRRAVFSIDDPSPTIRGVNRPKPANYNKHEGDPVDPETVRAMTFRERALVQTFPESYAWPEGMAKTDLEQMVGNAVPVGLAAYVGRHLLSWLISSQGETLLAAE